ncbi:hypothetical protein IJ750_02840 [bacterium]|nr:hypothetical protein [bacterium]
MRQSIIIFLTLFSCLTCATPAQSAIIGNVKYSLPIDYSQIDIQEYETKAENFYNSVLNMPQTATSEELTSALNLYGILSNANPENIIYPLRLGKLYEIAGKDRYAKGNFYRAMGIDPNRPEPYYYLAEFFFNREQYRRAYKMFLRAQEHGYKEHELTIEKLEILNKKLGIEKSKSDN